MDTDEREIFQFLKIWGGSFTSAREIARRAGSKKRFHEDPDWAKPILLRMTERGILESDIQGRFRIKRVVRRKHAAAAAVAETAPTTPEGGATAEDNDAGAIVADDYYEKL